MDHYLLGGSIQSKLNSVFHQWLQQEWRNQQQLKLIVQLGTHFQPMAKSNLLNRQIELKVGKLLRQGDPLLISTLEGGSKKIRKLLHHFTGFRWLNKN